MICYIHRQPNGKLSIFRSIFCATSTRPSAYPVGVRCRDRQVSIKLVPVAFHVDRVDGAVLGANSDTILVFI
jgi:hypothetical protein